MNLRLINIKQLGGVHPLNTKALRGKALDLFPFIENAFLTLRNGKIAEFGPMSDCPQDETPTQDLTGRCVLPAFVDSHSHLVYAGTREQEFNLRLKGASYEEIATAGGGILNSAGRVAATTQNEMQRQSALRLNRLVANGTGTLEIKSGYGLDPENELKMLRTVKKLNEVSAATLVPTFLAAHALPAWAKAQGMNDARYTKYMLDECLPTIQNEGLAGFLDGFIERDYFKLDALQHLIDASTNSGLPLKIHVNQFYDIGGIQMAVEAGALSVDHLEVMSPGAIKALHGSNTIATLLPSCSYFLGIPYAPARQLIEENTLVALATDYNPGSSPGGNMQLVCNMACAKMKMTPAEALNAATLNGAAALNLSDRKGSIAVGKDADILITKEIPSLEYICYDFGTNHIQQTLLAGLPS
ncbi:MAG: imidazolonepropionase [Schleiferiaceae bacterium]|nr:imidazolonepropionase [Schleiferiaceae bacterium]